MIKKSRTSSTTSSFDYLHDVVYPRPVRLRANYFVAPLTDSTFDKLCFEAMEMAGSGELIPRNGRHFLALIARYSNCNFDYVSKAEMSEALPLVVGLWTHEERVESYCRTCRNGTQPTPDDLKSVLEFLRLEVTDSSRLVSVLNAKPDRMNALLMQITAIAFDTSASRA